MITRNSFLRGVRSGLVFLSGYRPAAAAVRANTRMARSAAADIGAATTAAFTDPDPAPPTAPSAASPADRFELLRRQLSLTGADIQVRQATAARRFTLWIHVALLAFVYALVAPKAGLLGHSYLPWLDVMLPWIVAASFAARAAQWSLWHMRLRRRAFTPVGEWARSWEWLDPMSDRAKRILGLCLAAVGAAVAGHPMSAMADTVSNGASIISSLTQKLPSTDLSYLFIQRLFPSAFSDSGVSYQQDAVALMFVSFNSVVAFLACLKLLFHTVHAMVDVAHEGTVLSRKWHTTWAPIRVALGAGSVVPINGYCAAQLLMIQACLLGFNLANTEWKTYVQAASGLTSTAATVIPPNASDQAQTFHAVAASEACYWTLKFLNSPTLNQTAPRPLLQRILPGYGPGRPKVAYPDKNGTTVTASDGTQERVWDYGMVCGRISWPITTVTANTATNNAINATASSGAPPPSTGTNPAQANNTFDVARADALGTFIGQLRSTALMQWEASTVTPGMDNSAVPDLPSLLKTAATNFADYKGAILKASGTLSGTLNAAGRQAFLDRANAVGWFGAGAMIPEIVRANAEVVHRVAETPRIEQPDASSLGKEEKRLVASAQNSMERLLAATTATGGTIDPTAIGETEIEWSLKNPSGILDKLTGGFSHRVNAFLLSEGQLDLLNPIGDLQVLGNNVIWATNAMQLTWVGLSAAIGGADGAAQSGTETVNSIPLVGWVAGIFGASLRGVTAAAKAAIESMAPLVGQFLTVARLVGYGYAVVLPMLPFVTWFMLVLNIMLRVVTSVATAQLWAYSHVSMEGDQLINRGAQMNGFGLLLMKVIAPAMAVFGLVFAQVMMSASVYAVNSLYGLGSEMATRGEFLDPWMLLASLAMMMYLHYRVIVTAYSLPSRLVDTATLFLESVSEYRLESGEGFHGELEGKTQNIFGAINISRRPGGGGRPPKPKAPSGDTGAGAGGGQEGGQEQATGQTPGQKTGVSKVPTEGKTGGTG